MSPIDRDLLAERALVVERHLARVAQRLPATPDALALLAAVRDRL